MPRKSASYDTARLDVKQVWTIYNPKTDYDFGRLFDSRAEAVAFVEYLQAGTSLKLFWTPRKLTATDLEQ